MLREIDRELVNLRREEANACMHYRLYHAATLAAGSGVELLLECLVGDLFRFLVAENPESAEILKSDLKDFEFEKGDIHKWGLGVWSEFYFEYQIPFKLSEAFSYKSKCFNDSRIRKVIKEWNRCKHDVHEALPRTAREIVDYLNELLDEVGIRSTKDRGKLAWRQTWGDRINYWTVQNRASPETELLLMLFPLLEVVERLISDKRVGYEHKTRLMLAENYVFSTKDLVAEDVRQPRSLVDDAAVLSLTLYWLLRQPTFDNSLLHENWQRDTNARDEIVGLYKYITENHGELFRDSPGQFGVNLAWAAIRRISDMGPEALWQNYWAEAY